MVAVRSYLLTDRNHFRADTSKHWRWVFAWSRFEECFPTMGNRFYFFYLFFLFLFIYLFFLFFFILLLLFFFLLFFFFLFSVIFFLQSSFSNIHHITRPVQTLIFIFYIWAATWQNRQSDCAPSEDSDQPGHPPSLIRVFAVRMEKALVLNYPLSAQRRLWSDWVDAQADLSLRWAHSHFFVFVMSRLICLNKTNKTNTYNP